MFFPRNSSENGGEIARISSGRNEIIIACTINSNEKKNIKLMIVFDSLPQKNECLVKIDADTATENNRFDTIEYSMFLHKNITSITI